MENSMPNYFGMFVVNSRIPVLAAASHQPKHSQMEPCKMAAKASPDRIFTSD